MPPPRIAYRGPSQLLWLARLVTLGNVPCAGNLAAAHGFAELVAILAVCSGQEILELDVFQVAPILDAPIRRKVPRLVVPKIDSRTRSRRGRRGWRHRSGARLGHRRERLGLRWLRRRRLGQFWLLCSLWCLDRCEGAAARFPHKLWQHAMLLVAVVVVDAVCDAVLAAITHSANDASEPNSLRLDAAILALNFVSHGKYVQRRLRFCSLVFERGLACVRQALKGGLLCALARAGALERRHSFDLGR
mmetsp:Transcript_35570/g.90257  ORF Transcript_35570/g.90257 Transcript_35570/m.90257 type:complete len:247 (+) Transcript_35570:203-943(+)